MWGLNEPSTADNQCMSSKDVENHEQNCIVRDHEDWRSYSCTLKGVLSPSSGYWCAEASPETINTAQRRRRATHPRYVPRQENCTMRIQPKLGIDPRLPV